MTDQLSPQLVDKENLRSLIAEVLDVETTEVTDDAHFVDDLDVDSLMALEIAVRLEKTYGVKVAEGEMAAITSINGTHDLLESKLRASA